MKYREFLEEAPDAFFAHDLEGRISDVNRKACESLGYSREELLNMTVMDIEQDFDMTAAKVFWERVRSGETMAFSGRHRRRDGTVFPVDIHLGVCLVGGSKTLLALAHDITSRKKAENRQDRLTKLYRALSEVNQAIVRMETESELFPLVCRMAVDFGGMKMAWVGQMNPASGLIEPIVNYGSGSDYLDDITISGSDAVPEGRGPSGMAYRENRNVIVNDLRADLSMRPWLGTASSFGFESCGSFPVFRGDKPFAVFTVYHEQADAFDEEAVGLLDEMSRDISFALNNFDRERERQSAEEALYLSEDKFSKIFHNSPNPISVSRLEDGKFIDVNEAWRRIIGYSGQEAIGRTALELGVWANPEDRNKVVEALRESGHIRGVEFSFRTMAGNEVMCLVSAEKVAIQNEQCLVLVAQDISELKQAMETIQEQNNFLNAVFESEPHCVKVVSPEGRLIQMNRAGLAMLEVDSLEEAQRTELQELILPDYRKAYLEFHGRVCRGSSGVLEFAVVSRKGSQRWLETHATPLRKLNGEIIGMLGVTRDITAKKQADALIWKQANFDFLTDLPNRHMFYDRLEQEIRKAHRDGGALALFFIDLDRFKEVNDALGHQTGDTLLVEAAKRISACIGESDTLARLGGDEFAILSGMRETMHIENVAQHILDALSEPFSVAGKPGRIYVSASIGITLYPGDAVNADQLLKNADQALYAAKNAGRNRFSYFTQSLQEKAQARLRLLNDLRGALSANQFLLYFQPIMDISSNRIVKAETLLRWKHPERGMVSPMEFIPLAEETGLILEIGDWVFREAARWASLWTKRHPDLEIGVNMSPLQFKSGAGSINAWLEHLRQLGLSGRNVAIEITESLLLDADSEVTGRLNEFRNADIRVAIDDFGTGYSALSYLKKFHIDYLKIDRAFVRNLASDSSDMALSEAIIVMAHKLGLKVIAEGVETVEQRDLLLQAGCDYAQGYLFSKPIPPEEFEARLDYRT